MKKIVKLIWVVIFNIISVLYLIELLITLFLPSQVNSYIDLDYLRYQRAIDLGIKFDKRTYYQAFYEEKKK